MVRTHLMLAHQSIMDSAAMTGGPQPWNTRTVRQMYSNCASRSGCCRPPASSGSPVGSSPAGAAGDSRCARSPCDLGPIASAGLPTPGQVRCRGFIGSPRVTGSRSPSRSASTFGSRSTATLDRPRDPRDGAFHQARTGARRISPRSSANGCSCRTERQSTGESRRRCLGDGPWTPTPLAQSLLGESLTYKTIQAHSLFRRLQNEPAVSLGAYVHDKLLAMCAIREGLWRFLPSLAHVS